MTQKKLASVGLCLGGVYHKYCEAPYFPPMGKADPLDSIWETLCFLNSLVL